MPSQRLLATFKLPIHTEIFKSNHFLFVVLVVVVYQLNFYSVMLEKQPSLSIMRDFLTVCVATHHRHAFFFKADYNSFFGVFNLNYQHNIPIASIEHFADHPHAPNVIIIPDIHMDPLPNPPNPPFFLKLRQGSSSLPK